MYTTGIIFSFVKLHIYIYVCIYDNHLMTRDHCTRFRSSGMVIDGLAVEIKPSVSLLRTD